MCNRDLISEFNAGKNRHVLEDYHRYVANILAANKVPLDNVFFVSTPAFLVFYSKVDKAILQRPASDYCDFITRKVIFEKCKIDKKFKCYYHRQTTEAEALISRPLASMSYRLNWNESMYGEEFDCMKALSKYIKSKSHLPIFMYVDEDFFNTIKRTKIIRAATLDFSFVI